MVELVLIVSLGGVDISTNKRLWTWSVSEFAVVSLLVLGEMAYIDRSNLSGFPMQTF